MTSNNWRVSFDRQFKTDVNLIILLLVGFNRPFSVQ